MTLTLRAEVRGGRLVLDEAIDLPEGSVIELVPADMGDSLDEDHRARLHAALERASAQIDAGMGKSAEEVFARLGIRDDE